MASDALDDVALERLPLLAALPPEVRSQVRRRFVRAAHPFGTVIVREGEPADALYVLASGRARVIKRGDNGDEVALNVLRSGDVFGEMALLERGTRMATVRASSDVGVWRLHRPAFEELLVTFPDLKKYLEQQVARRRLQNFFRAPTPRSRACRSTRSLPCWRSWSRRRWLRVSSSFDRATPGPMYIVEAGRLRVFVEEDGSRRYLRYLRRGDFFGELSLFKHEDRTSTVEAVEPCRLLRLNASTFNQLLEGYPEFRTQLEERIAQYDYRTVARVPLDFADETLPAELRAHEKVGPQQVEATDGEEEDVDGQEASAAPFATQDGRFVKRARRIRRFPFVRQLDAADCGAAALAMVCRHYGRAVSLARIRRLCFAATDGTSLRAICRAATELGLAARPVKVSARNLAQMPLPAIVHWDGNHWVVVYDVVDGHVRLADPGLGLRRLPRAEFEQR
jgi:CRP-like cAMP-binding protein